MNNEMGITDDEVILRFAALYKMGKCPACVADAILMGFGHTSVTIPDVALRSLIENDRNDGTHEKGVGFLIVGDGIRVLRNLSVADTVMAKKTDYADHGAFGANALAERYLLAVKRKNATEGGSP